MAGSRIKGITVEINGDVTKLTDALSKVNVKTKEVSNTLKDLNRLLKFDPKNTELLKQKQSELAEKVKATKEKLDQEKEALEQLKNAPDQTKELVQQQENLKREIEATTEEYKKAKKEMQDFGSVGAQKMAAVGTKMKSIGEKVAGVGSKMTMGFTVPVVAGATAAVSAYGDVDKQFRLVEQTMGTTSNSAEDFQGLWNQLGTSAKNSVYGMQDAADATLNFARQGFSAKEATDMLTPAMSLAAGTGTDLSTVTAGLGNSLKMFGADSSEAANYADILARAQAQANTDTTQLFEAMSIAGPICQTVGWDISDLATITDIFGNAGISGSEGATALKTGIARLAAPTKDAAGAMDSLGLSTGQTNAIFNDDGSMKSMPEVLANLRNGFSGLTEEQTLSAASTIFGKNQMAKWLTLIQTSPEEVNGLRDALDSCTGSADDMANALMSGTGGSLEQLKSTFDVFKVELGEQLAPAFQPVIQGLTNLMNGFMALSPETQQMIIRIVATVAAIGPLLLIGGKLMVGIGQLLIFAPLLQGALLAFGGPILGVTLAIGTAVAAGVALYQNWDTIKEKCTELGQHISERWDAVKQATAVGWDEIKSDVSGAWEGIKTGVSDGIETAKTAVVNGWENIKSQTQSDWDAIQSDIDAHGGGIQGVLGAAVDNIKSNWQNGFDRMNEISGGRLGDILSSVGDKVESMKEKFRSGLDAIGGFFDGLHLELPHINLPHFGLSGGFSLNPPSVPHITVDWYAKAMEGGMILNSPTIFGAAGGKLLGGGEAGPEAVVGTKSLYKMIASAVARASGGVTVNVYGAEGQSVTDLARAVGDVLTKQMQKKEAVWA